LYRELARKHALLLQDVEDMKAKNLALEESVKSLANKLASRDRADALAAKRPIQPVPPMDPVPVVEPGQDPLEYLKAQGLAVPMGQHQPTANHNTIPNHFGKVAIGGGAK